MRIYPQNDPPTWAAENLQFHTLSHFFRHQFGRKVWKISVDAGLGCPNLDGTLGRGGCVFCDNRSFSPSRRTEGSTRSVAAQIAEGASRLRRRYGDSADAFIAYFQPGTNTHGPLSQLLPLWREAVAQPGVVGLTVGTRPDCAGAQILDALAELATRTWVSIEFGLQTIHQKSLDWLGRGHNYLCFEESVTAASDRGLLAGAHLMLGLPGETPNDTIETARALARLPVHSVKLHNLYVVQDTPLEARFRRGEFQLPSREEYVELVVDFLEQTPSDCVIDRIVGDAPPQYLVAPDWCAQKAAIRQAVEAEFKRRGTRQGSCWQTR